MEPGSRTPSLLGRAGEVLHGDLPAMASRSFFLSAVAGFSFQLADLCLGQVLLPIGENRKFNYFSRWKVGKVGKKLLSYHAALLFVYVLLQ